MDKWLVYKMWKSFTIESSNVVLKVVPLVTMELPQESDIDTGGTQNPFTFDLKLRAVKFFTKKKHFRASDLKAVDGIMLGKGSVESSEIAGYHYTDAGKSTKLFRDDGARELVMGLEGATLKLFVAICLRLTPKADKVKLDAKVYTAMMGVTLKTFYTSVNKLIRYNVIARYKSKVYWINPAIMFSGDRLEKWPDKMEIIATQLKEDA